MKNPVVDKKTRIRRGEAIPNERSHRGGSYREPIHARLGWGLQPRPTGISVLIRRFGSYLKPSWKEDGVGFRVVRNKK